MPSDPDKLSNVEEGSRKAHFGEPPDTAKTRAVALTVVLRQRYLDRDGGGTWTWYLRCEQAIVGARR